MLDGIDGSGKSTIIYGLAEHFQKKGFKVFDLKNYWQKNKTYPEFFEISGYDIILSAEPTSAWIGEAIRKELISNEQAGLYSAKLISEAFSLDRAVLYRRIIIPALQAGKIVLQDRGVTTSIIYQPAQQGGVKLNEVLRLEGNALALKWAPDILMLADIAPRAAMARLARRTAKKDNVIFEKLPFQNKVYKRFRSGWFKKLMSRFGAKIYYVDASKPPKEMIGEAIKVLKNYISK